MTELVKPELQSLVCSDIEDIASWQPADDVVDYWLQVDVGEAGNPAASEYFQVRVVDPKTLGAEGTRPLRACVVTNAAGYSFMEVQHAIASTVESCARGTWIETAVAISRYFLWEYEGYPIVAGTVPESPEGPQTAQISYCLEK